MTRTALAIATSLAAAFAAAPISALAMDSEARTVTVQYGDLNLNSTEGVDAMLNRIERASESACGVTSGRADLRTQRFQRECVAETIANTVETLGVASVTSAYADRHGAAPARTASLASREG
ncbi:MAG: UrcA family protein [Alphaproteobacteria bacterium]|nr:UrcA family protein [Alphaproteobacteria bacterium]